MDPLAPSTHSQTNNVHMYTHVHTTRAFSPRPPVPLENSDLTELKMRSAICVMYNFLVHFADSFYILHQYRMWRSLEISNAGKIQTAGFPLTNHSESSMQAQFLFDCRAAPHCFFVSLLTFWKYQLANFQVETNKQTKKLCFITFL